MYEHWRVSTDFFFTFLYLRILVGTNLEILEMSEFFLLFVGNNENSTEKKVWIDKAVKNEAVKSSYASVVKGERSSPVNQVMKNTLREQQPIKGARERM